MTNIQEIWKPIKNYEGLYEVSNLGRVMSKDRTYNNGHCDVPINGILLKTYCNSNGYEAIKISKGGIKKHFLIHRLVLSAFVENVENKRDINHIDCNKKNNVLSNLEWSTRSENMIHAIKHGLKVEKTGDDRHTSKPVKVVDINTGNQNDFGSIQSCAKALNEKHNAIEYYLKFRSPLGKLFRKQYKINFI